MSHYSKSDQHVINAVNAAVENSSKVAKRVASDEADIWSLVLLMGSVAVLLEKTDMYQMASVELANMAREAAFETGNDREEWDRLLTQRFKSKEQGRIVKSFMGAVAVLTQFNTKLAEAAAKREMSNAGMPEDLIETLLSGDIGSVTEALLKVHLKVKDDEQEDVALKRGFNFN